MGRLGALVAVAAAVAAIAAPAAHARTITLSGSTPAGAVVADLAYFYRHATSRVPRFSIVGGGTATGIADAARGIVDAGLAGRAPSAEDAPGLVFTPFALSGICLVTNVANPVPGLSRAQIQDLVAGRVSSWSQVPGSPRTDAMTPVALDRGTADASVFQSVFVDLATPMDYAPRTFGVPADVRDFIAATPSAWGYVDLAFARGLHAVAYEGIPCETPAILSGAYPARTPLGFVTRGRPRGALARFVRWVTHSRTAKRVIATRYIPAG